ncbi:hypothetical protein GCM10010195_65850 [Kitasatospora griseola]|nr:hypothetical protein GCM10010195_65850 [Kitasatospora griseola]
MVQEPADQEHSQDHGAGGEGEHDDAVITGLRAALGAAASPNGPAGYGAPLLRAGILAESVGGGGRSSQAVGSNRPDRGGRWPNGPCCPRPNFPITPHDRHTSGTLTQSIRSIT